MNPSMMQEDNPMIESMRDLIFQGRSRVILGVLLCWMGIVGLVADSWVTGVTEPVNDVIMSSPVSGIIGARLFEEGAKVKKGEVIVELDKQLEELELLRRKLFRDLAETELNRLRTLSARGTISVSQEEIEKKDAEYQVAAVEYQIAEENRRRRLLVAPFDGIIAEFYLKVSEGCEARQSVVRLVNPGWCYFIVNVEAKSGHALREGQEVLLEIDSGADTVRVAGALHYISPVVDPASGLRKMKAAFNNSDGQIAPGVAGRMLLGKESNAR